MQFGSGIHMHAATNSWGPTGTFLIISRLGTRGPQGPIQTSIELSGDERDSDVSGISFATSLAIAKSTLPVNSDRVGTITCLVSTASFSITNRSVPQRLSNRRRYLGFEMFDVKAAHL